MKMTAKILTLFALSVFIFSSCTKQEQTQIYTANAPVYMSYDDLRNSVQNDNDRALINPGKIFLYNNLIMINDFEEGIHVYDNTNPSNPQHVAFINIPGNVDMAVRNDVLYADSYVDIVAIDISNPADVKEIGRATDVLSYTIPSKMNYDYPVARIDPSKGVVLDYEIREVEEMCKNDECGYKYYSTVMSEQGEWAGSMMSDNGTVVNFAGNSNTVRSMTTSSNKGAIAGSMARFMMVEDALYAISNQSTVKVFMVDRGSISHIETFDPWSDAGGWGQIETLFNLKDKLFIGSTTGMLAYDITSPAHPVYLSNYTHMTGCDPVVANDDYAFITLRAGTACGNPIDVQRLDVIKISDIMNPTFLHSVSMNDPHGLALDNSNEVLVVCDGSFGATAYDVSNVGSLRLLGKQSGDSYDVIVQNNIAFIIGEGGLVQYSYDATGFQGELSRISLD